MVYRSRQEATEALDARLERVEPGNYVAAARAVGHIVRRFDPEATSTADAFRETARKRLEPFFSEVDDPSRAVAWALADADAQVSENGSKPPVDEAGIVRPEYREMVDASDLLSDPESLRVPDPILPGLAYPRSLTLASGKPKVAGKTSLLTAGCYAVATGSRFLGRPAQQGRVLWVLAEGSDRHIGRYLAQVEAELPPDRFKIVRPGVEPIENLRRDLEEYPADLVCVDSLSPWLAPLDVDLYTDEVVGPLTEVYRIADYGPAVVLIHHSRKADDDPAGSHKIKAIPDVVRTLKQGESPRERVLEGVGRWDLPTLRYRMRVTGDHPQVPNLETARFSLVDPDRPVTEKILDLLDQEPGLSKNEVRAKVNARASAVDAGLEELESAEKVVVDRSGRSHSYRIAQDPDGHRTDTVGRGDGRGDSGCCPETVSEGALSSLEESPRTLEDTPVSDEEAVKESELPF